MRKNALFVILLHLVLLNASAKEGMWIPILLEKYNLEEMQQMGFKLSAEDIYDVNNASMKDAIVIFGSGCTAELISEDGLLITNHHCGFSNIQFHSSVENDYLKDGFWAKDRSEELPNQGLTVSFLEYMKDMTSEVLNGTDGLSELEEAEKIRNNIAQIERKARENGKFSAQIKPLFYGNQYFLYVYKIYRDVRLVGAPPSSIGKFGGDTDNWMWPRHTGDFSLFRIYAGKDNEPADYSPDNVPFTPKRFFPISLKGVEAEDFTMVFGNPGSTMQYIPSNEVDIIMNQRDPDRIKIRDKKLEVISVDMQSDPKIRIQYAAKYASISNAWKKWQGEIKGLERLNANEEKKKFENEFKVWAQQNRIWENEYKNVFENFDLLYKHYKSYIKAGDYYNEIVTRGPEIFSLATQAELIINAVENSNNEQIIALKNMMAGRLQDFYKDFNQPTDERLFEVLLPMLLNDLEPEFLPVEFLQQMRKHNADKWIDKIYRKSVLTDTVKLMRLIKDGNDKQWEKLKKDPIIQLHSTLNQFYTTEIATEISTLTQEINKNMKKYMAGIISMKEGEALYPDANLTLRVTYGKIEGYQPIDGVTYKHYTTLEGIMEKDNPEVYDYDVPEKLKELYANKDFGRYEVDGTVPVCFTASNHTSGGNSGSPVINGDGHLIGVNFDRCWEGTMSDIMFDPEMCRNISIDIRYALFIIDKFAGAGYLLDEMVIVE